MRHVVTMTEAVEAMGFSGEFSADDYNVAVVLAEVIELLKANPRCGETVSGRLSNSQVAKAMGMLLSLVVAHEQEQDKRERASR